MISRVTCRVVVGLVLGLAACDSSDASPDAGGRSDADASVTPDGDASVTPDGDASVTPDGDASVTPDGDASVTPDGDASVTPDGDASVTPDGDASATPDGDVAEVTGPTPGPAVSFALMVGGGSFESAPGDSPLGLPSGWFVTGTWPEDSTVEAREYATDGITAPAGLGERGLLVASHHLHADGEQDGNRVELMTWSGLEVIPGVTYELSAMMYNPGSSNWWGAGPDLGFTIDQSPVIRTPIPIASLPDGEWTEVKASLTGTAADSGKLLRLVFGAHGNATENGFPGFYVDGVKLTVSMPGSFTVPNADFASPEVTGATSTLPTGWTATTPHPSETDLGLVRPPGAGINEDLGGNQLFRLGNRRQWADGDPDPVTLAIGPVVTTAVPGRTYLIAANLYNRGSCNWYGSGPGIGFMVGGTKRLHEIPILGIISWGEGDGYLAAYSWTAGPDDEGDDIAPVLEVNGSSGATCHPEIYVDEIWLGSTL
ncbi:MAG: hypothetical protein H6744_10660 [Deltaproteobacteria bacterium]|nr:hypothetical protein [Deltaproteobacteria bacterium]